MYGTTNFCGCGTQYPIVPGSNPSLVTWDGQKFVVADGSKQLPINLPYIQHSNVSNAPFLLCATPTEILSKLKFFAHIPINYLLVGGGGACGDSDGGPAGGGGGGGVLTSSFTLNSANVINVSVGSGGIAAAGDTGANGGNGQSSIISFKNQTLTALGGGGGGSAGTGANGSSGGGGGALQAGGTATQGHNGSAGGKGIYIGEGYGGGGGGAGTAGTPATYDGSGNVIGGGGGNGIASSITGTSVYYGAGGGGSADNDGDTYTIIGGLGYGNYGSGSQTKAYDFNLAGFSGVCILSIPNQYFSGIYTNATQSSDGAGNTILTFTGNGTYTT